MELNTILPGRLKDARQKRGYKQKDLAERCGCKQAIISNAENGRSVPEIGTLIRMAQELRVSLDWLCGIEKDESITAVQWLDYMARLLDDPPQDGAGHALVKLLGPGYSDEAGFLQFKGDEMIDFFTAYSGIQMLKGKVKDELYYEMRSSFFEKYAAYFTPGYKAPPSDFADLEDEADEKVPF